MAEDLIAKLKSGKFRNRIDSPYVPSTGHIVEIIKSECPGISHDELWEKVEALNLYFNRVI